MPKHKTAKHTTKEKALSSLCPTEPRLGRLMMTMDGLSMMSISPEQREIVRAQGLTLKTRTADEIRMRLNAQCLLLALRHPETGLSLPTGTYDVTMVSIATEEDVAPWKCTVFDAVGVIIATCTVDC